MKNNKCLFLLLALTSIFALNSCNLEDECLTGTVRFTNNSNNPYDLYIEGQYQFRMDGNTFQELELTEGQHRARAEQVSGFLLFPTIVTEELNVFGCQESQWVFP